MFCCRLLIFFFFFFKINFFQNIFQEHYIRVSNDSNPDQDRHSVGLDLGPNRLQTTQIPDSKGTVLFFSKHIGELTKANDQTSLQVSFVDSIRKQIGPRSVR